MPNRIDILLAEDNVSDAELARESVGTLTTRMIVVRDGVEALDFLFGRGEFDGRPVDPPPRLVVLDIKLPRVDGFGVLREIRKDPRTRLVPVVMLTSSIIENDVREAYELGANSFVQKPMDFDLFRSTIESVCRYWLTTNQDPPRRAIPAGGTR